MRPAASISTSAKVVVGLLMLAVAACTASRTDAMPVRTAGCSAPRTGHLASDPIPMNVARRLPSGVFYILAGPNADSTNLWQVTNSGCERQLTFNRRGFGVSDFAASRAGVILSDGPSGVDQLARLGPHGPVLLPDGFVSTVGIDPEGRVV